MQYLLKCGDERPKTNSRRYLEIFIEGWFKNAREMFQQEGVFDFLGDCFVTQVGCSEVLPRGGTV